METTKDGFTFKRHTATKAAQSKIQIIPPSFPKQNISDSNTSKLSDDFSFKILKTKNINKNKTKKNLRTFSRKNLKENSLEAIKILSQNTSKATDEPSTFIFKKIIHKNKISQNYNSENKDNFNTIKKRNTIQMDDNLDISTESNASEKEFDKIADQTLKFEMPKPMEKIKSYEIHKNVSDGNINTLIANCIDFLKTEDPYSKEIVKHCNSNYFRDIEYRKEIDSVTNKKESIKQQIDMWNSVYNSQKKNMVVNTVSTISSKEDENQEDLQIENLTAEFEDKSQKLRSAECRLKYFLEIAKSKSESLLRSVFDTMDEHKVDTLFLLKAMSRLGR